MSRGFVWGVYVDDQGGSWAKRVDADQLEDPNRGWTVAPAGLSPLPREWLARRVEGVDETGRKQSTVVGSLEAPLWTGAVGTFVVEANDGELVTATVTAFLGERRRGP